MTLLRLTLVAAGLVFAALLLVFGLVAAIALVGWNLLRGRRPAWRFQVNRGGKWPSAAHRGTARPDPRDVVDVEVREIPDERSNLPGR